MGYTENGQVRKGLERKRADAQTLSPNTDWSEHVYTKNGQIR